MDELTSTGYNPGASDATSSEALFDISLEEARSEMSEKDPRLLVVLDMLEDRKTVPDIMKKLDVLQSKTIS